jgi:hypothetical protein
MSYIAQKCLEPKITMPWPERRPIECGVLARPASASPLQLKSSLSKLCTGTVGHRVALCVVPEDGSPSPPSPGWGNQNTSDGGGREHAIQETLAKIARFIPKRTDAKAINAESKSEIYPVAIRDSRRPKLCAGQIWREIRANETSSWPYDHGRSPKIKNRERAFLLDGCSYSQGDWQERRHLRDFCLQIAPP